MKIEEYLNSLEKKELIYIFLSIPIVVFIVYYNFVYPMLSEKNKKLSNKEKKVQKELYTVASKIRKVKGSKNILLPTRRKLDNLKEDYRYLSYNFDTVDFIKLDDKKIYIILTKLLNKANSLNLGASFDVAWNKKQLPPFSQYIEITITGNGNYIALVRYLQFIDHLRALINVTDVKVGINLDDKKDIKESLKIAKKAESSSVSFILTRYSENTINYFRNLAKSKHLVVSMGVNSRNVNYLNVGYKGSFSGIKSIIDLLKNVKKQKNPIFTFTDLRAQLKFVQKNKKASIQKQQFKIGLQMVGVK